MSAVRTEQTVVMAGGLATRLGRLAARTPKALLPVPGGTFLELMLEPMRASGLRRFHFCLGHLGESVREHLSGMAADGLEISSVIEPNPRGTAGALLHNADQLGDMFLLALGDTYLEIDYGDVLDRFPGDALAMMVVTQARCEVEPNVGLAGDRVVAYDKSGVANGLTDTGITVVRRQALDLLHGGRDSLDLSVLFQELIRHGALSATTTDERFFDIGTPDRHRKLVDHINARLRAGRSIQP